MHIHPHTKKFVGSKSRMALIEQNTLYIYFAFVCVRSLVKTNSKRQAKAKSICTESSVLDICNKTDERNGFKCVL